MNLLADAQYGFGKTRYCMDNLTILVDYLHRPFFQNEYVAALFLHNKGAYNSDIPKILLRKLSELNILKEYLNFFENLLYSCIVLYNIS